jgi:hypothetical protein
MQSKGEFEMKSSLSLSEIVESAEGVEVGATAELNYDPATQEARVELDSFSRNVGPPGGFSARVFLPAPERVVEHLPREEASAFARDVFGLWVKKVKATIPHPFPSRNELRPMF